MNRIERAGACGGRTEVKYEGEREDWSLWGRRVGKIKSKASLNAVQNQLINRAFGVSA